MCRASGLREKPLNFSISLLNVGMLAIPVLRCRVAPVLDWCSRIQIFPMDSSYKGAGRVLILPHLDATQRLKVLRAEGVSILICGTLSVDLLRHARRLGLIIISGVAGEVEEVVRSYWKNTLDHPKFWLPGCRGPRQHCSSRMVRGLPGDSVTRPRGRNGRIGRSNQPRAIGLGPGGFCLCPACSFKIPHEQGIPCVQVRCPRCGQIMERA